MEKSEKIEVYSREDAWKKAQELFPGDYEQDELGTKNAGYPVYRATDKTNGSYISDLGCRLELNIRHNDGSEHATINIWIEDRRYTAKEVREIVSVQRKEMEAITAIRLAAEVMDTEAGKQVIKLLNSMEIQVKARLEQFGF